MRPTTDKDGAACYCCGDPQCRLHRCEKKERIAPKDWHKPEYAPGGAKATAQAANHTTVVVEETESNHDTVICDDPTAESLGEFSGVQKVICKEKCCNAECKIFDSGSTVTLSKDRSKISNIRPVKNKVTMVSNGGNTKLDEKGDWKEWGDSYLCESAVTNIVSVSDAVKKGF